MQAIGADHEIELARVPVFELNAHTIFPVFKADDLVVEYYQYQRPYRKAGVRVRSAPGSHAVRL